MQPRPLHPLWQYLPPERRTRKARLLLRRQRLLAWLKRKQQLIGLFLGTYIILWLIPLLFQQGLITAFAFLPLILVPPVGLLIYWLVWEEFHG
jgi:hypothetical protein